METVNLNEERNNFNNKVSRLNILGECRTVKWNKQRRFPNNIKKHIMDNRKKNGGARQGAGRPKKGR